MNLATDGTEVAPRLSIVLATRQAERTLERCLRSIIEQKFTGWELLIADGASSDGTVDIIRRHEKYVAWWRSEADHGIYDAWNAAVSRARGQYVCFLGADDAWTDSRAVERLFAAIDVNAYDLVTSRGLMVDPSTGKAVEFGSAWNYDRIGRRMVVCHPGLLHRRSLFEHYGPFDTRYRIAGDLDFLLRLPPDIETLHVDAVSVRIEGAGVSQSDVLARLREQREALVRCERYGPLRAYLAWMDKLWRLPIARLLGLPH